MNKVIWLTGNSGAGKTTIARALQRKLRKNNISSVILDGDEMRQSISLNAGFSKEDREQHNLRVARLANELVKQHLVIVSVIAPFNSTREKVDKICDINWIYVKRKLPKNKERPYEKGNYFIVDTNKQTLEECVSVIIEEVL